MKDLCAKLHSLAFNWALRKLMVRLETVELVTFWYAVEVEIERRAGCVQIGERHDI